MPPRKLTDEEILRIARGRVTESSAGTFTQVEIDTQLSVERGVIWMLDWVEFDFDSLNLLAEVSANSIETIRAQITRTTQTALVNGNDPDLIQSAGFSLCRSAAIGTDAGPLNFFSARILRYNFHISMPVASQSIFFAIKGSGAAAHVVSARIGYTLRQVTDQYFFRVAQALVG